MKDRRKVIYTFILIMSFTIISIAGGLLALYSAAHDRISPNAYVETFAIGGLTKQEAIKELNGKYENLLKDRSLVINYNSKNTKNEFKIDYSDIDAKVDFESTVDKALNKKDGQLLETLIDGYFNSKKRSITPDVSFNKGKLVKKLEELSTLINREPKYANIYLIDNKVTKEPEINGLKLNIENAANKIEDEIGAHINIPIEFKTGYKSEIEVEEPKFTLENIKDAEEVISTYTTDIKSFELENSIRLAVKAINKVWILGKVKPGVKPGEFSFNEYLSNEKGIMEQNNEGYNQVVSTLYAALLKTNIDSSSITRTPHSNTVDYIKPGLDAVVLGNKVDFKFINTLDGVLVIFASVKNNKLTVSLVGKKKDIAVNNSLKIEVVQKFAPSVINIENSDLPSHRTKVISEGKDGVKVNVYKVINKDGVETDKRFLYSDKYSAQDAIVQVGSDVGWANDNINK